MNNREIKIIEKAVDEFEFVGVRDELTFREIIKHISDVTKVSLCCDPTFLYKYDYNVDNGKRILRKIIGSNPTKPIICVMTESDQVANKLYDRLKSDYILVCLYLWHPRYINGCLLSPFEWIDVLAACDCLITSFFHGVCFALKHNTPVLAIGTDNKNSKLQELEKSLNNIMFKVYDSRIIEDKEFPDILQRIQRNIKEISFESDSMMEGFLRMLTIIKSENKHGDI